MSQTNIEHQEEVRERILRHAMRQFFANGIKSVKMDDIAAELQMSKRTLYEMFEDKEHLLLESIRFRHRENKARIDALSREADNPLEVFAQVFNMKMVEIHEVSPQFITDAKRYDSIMKGFQAETDQRNADTLLFIQSCVDRGLFRPDVNYEVLIRLFDLANKAMMENEIYKEYPIDQIVYTLYDTIFRGMCTPAGLEILNMKIKQKQ